MRETDVRIGECGSNGRQLSGCLRDAGMVRCRGACGGDLGGRAPSTTVLGLWNRGTGNGSVTNSTLSSCRAPRDHDPPTGRRVRKAMHVLLPVILYVDFPPSCISALRRSLRRLSPAACPRNSRSGHLPPGASGHPGSRQPHRLCFGHKPGSQDVLGEMCNNVM